MRMFVDFCLLNFFNPVIFNWPKISFMFDSNNIINFNFPTNTRKSSKVLLVLRIQHITHTLENRSCNIMTLIHFMMKKILDLKNWFFNFFALKYPSKPKFCWNKEDFENFIIVYVFGLISVINSKYWVTKFILFHFVACKFMNLIIHELTTLPIIK